MKHSQKSKKDRGMKLLRQFKAFLIDTLFLDFLYQKPKKAKEISWYILSFGIIISAVGAGFLSGDNPNWFIGLPLQGIALWLIWISFPNQSNTFQPSVEKTVPSQKKDVKRIWFVILAMVIWGDAFFSFAEEWWPVGIIAALAFVGLLVIVLIRLRKLPDSKNHFSDKIALLLLMVITVLLRFPFLHLNITGLQPDEGLYLLNAIDYLQGKDKSPFHTDWYWCYFPRFLMAFPLFVFGVKLTAARGFSAFLSTIYVYFFYRWCRVYYGIWASFLAASFLSFCWWDLFFSFSTFTHVFTDFFEIIALFFIAKAFKEGNRFYFGLSGIFLAGAFMSYYSGPVVPIIVLVAATGFLLIGKKKFLKSYWKHFLLTLLTFLWLLGPLIIFLIKTPRDILGRANELSIWPTVINTNQWALPVERILGTFYTFLWPNYTGVNFQFGLRGMPYLDPFFGWFLILGITLGVFAFKRWNNLLAFIGLGFGIMANAFASESSNPDPLGFTGGRCFFVLPFLCFFIAQGLDWSMRFISALNKKYQIIGFLILAALFIGSAFMNINTYFFKFEKNQDSYNMMGFKQMVIADLLKGYYPKDHIVVEGHEYSGMFLSNSYDTEEKFLTYQQVQVNTGAPYPMPIKAQVTKDVVLFYADWEKLDDDKEKVRGLYPQAVWTIHKDKFGSSFLTTIEIKKEDVQNLQKGMKLDPPLI